MVSVEAGSALSLASTRQSPLDRRFVSFLVGVSLADLADRAWLVALTYTAVTTGSPFAATAVVAAGTVPRALLVLVGGSVADRLPARWLMIAADLFRAVVLGAALVALTALGEPSLSVLVVASVLFGVADSFHLPAVGTMPRQLVPPPALVRAAGLRQIGSRIASTAGPPAAGLVLAVGALTGTIACLVAVFVLAAGVTFFARPRYPRAPAERQTVLSSVRDLISHLREHRTVRHLVLALVGLNFFVIPVVTVGVALRTSSQGWGPTALGLVLGAIGLGAVLGTVLTFRVSFRFPIRIALVMLTLQGLALAVVGLASLSGVAAAMFVVGLTSGIASPLLAGTVQAIVDPQYLGRVYSVVALSDDGIMPIALLGFGAAVGVFGVSWTVLGCGIGMTLLMGRALLSRPLRDLEPVAATAPEPDESIAPA